MTLAACLIVRNEAANLRRCLASLQGVVDEVVVVDTGSTDDTVAIAEAAGARVGHVAWADDFAAARNAALGLATADWILVIDADEELVVHDRATLAAALDAGPCGFVLPLDDLDEQDRVTKTVSVLRLFPRDERVRYRGRIHETVEPDLAALGWPVGLLPALGLRHRGYTAAAVAAGHKFERNRRLMRLSVEEHPTGAAGWVHLAVLCLDAGDLAEARAAFASLARHAGGLDALSGPLYVQAILTLAGVERAEERPAAVVAVLDEGLQRVPGHPGLRFERGRARARLGDLAGAREDFEACLWERPEDWAAYLLPAGVTDALPKAALAQLDRAEGKAPRLSACLIVKDEAEFLPRCLASLQGVVDEVVVVDTGSTDDTVAIAEAAGARVGHFAWCNDFAAARNAALELATGDWVLVIDADEELVVDDPQALRAVVAGQPAVYVIGVHDAVTGRHEGQTGKLVRLFPRHPQLRFEGRVHEGVGSALQALGWPLRETAALHVLHHGYRPDVIARRNKPGRNLLLARMEAQEHPERALGWFNLARTALYASRIEEALGAWERLRAVAEAGTDADPHLAQYTETLQALCGSAIQILADTCARLARPLPAEPLLTACMIVRDEEEQLPRCLAALDGLVDELVVVDTGSLDDTTGVARRAGARLGHFTWEDDFSAARNAALDLATGRWVLTIDADEELVVTDPLAFRQALEGGDAQAYTLEVHNLDASGAVESRLMTAPRLFRRDPAVRYAGRLHEDVSEAMRAQGWVTRPLAGVVLRHHGYTPVMMLERKKIERNHRLAVLATQDRPDDPNTWHGLAAISWVGANNRATLEAAERARALVLEGRKLALHRQVALHWLIAAAARQLGLDERADAALDEGLTVFPGHPELAYERGIRRAGLGDTAGAIADFNACLAVAGRRFEGTIRTGITGFLVNMELAGIYTRERRLAEAVAQLELALADPNCPAAEREALARTSATLRGLAAQEEPAPSKPSAEQRRNEVLGRLEQTPRDPLLFLELALVCYEEGRLDLALVACEASLRLEATGRGYYMLGLVLAELGRPREAERAFGLVLYLDPEHPRALGMRLEMRGREQESELTEGGLAQLEAMLALARPTLTACLIVKDEAERLPACLASLAGFADEIVVVDTGSTDGTVAIAEAAGAKVGHFAWCDDFSAARNAALDLATSDWVLVIDADETLVVPEPEALLKGLRRRVPGGYVLTIQNLTIHGQVDQEALVMRLFQRLDGLRFKGRLNESVHQDLVDRGLVLEQLKGVVLRHTGYAREIVEGRKKPERNARIAAAAAQDNPQDAVAWFLKAGSLADAGDIAGAKQAYTQMDVLAGGLMGVPEGPMREHATMHRALFERTHGSPAAAEAMLSSGLTRQPGYPEFLFERAMARQQQGNRAGARADLEACLQADPAAWSHMPLRVGLTDRLPREALAAIDAAAPPEAFSDAEELLSLGFDAFKKGQYDRALAALIGAVGLNPQVTAAYYLLGLTLERLGQPRWAERFFSTTLQLDPGHPRAAAARESVRGAKADGEAPAELVQHLERLLSLPRPTLSACLIVKNEAPNLERCLGSLAGVVDEVIVVDTGSTDDTVAVARRLGAVVGHFAWVDDFAAARNAALAMATSDWILVIDADETLEIKDPAAFRLALVDRRPSAYVMPLADHLDGDEVLVSPVCRLIQRAAGLRYEERIHESLGPAINRLGWPVLELDVAVLHHYGNQHAEVARQNKLQRNMRIAQAAAEQNPEDIRAVFTIATTYHRAGQHQEAEAVLARLAATGAPDALEPRRYVQYLQVRAEVQRALGLLAEAEALLDQGLVKVPDYPEALFLRGQIRAQRGHTAGALSDFHACLAGDAESWHGFVLRPEVLDALPRAEIAKLGATPASPRDLLLQRLERSPRDAGAFLELGLLCYREGQYDRALLALDRALQLDASQPSGYYLLGLVMVQFSQPQLAERLFAQTLQLDPDHPNALKERLNARKLEAGEASPDLDARVAQLLALASPRLTACLIVKNEAEQLPRCLASLQDVVDEIVVVDTGSTDDTVAIAEAAGAKIGHFAWCDDFSAARNAALALATGDWIVTVDADEELVVPDPDALRRALRNRIHAGYVTVLDNVGPAGDVQSSSPMLRLFQHLPELRYRGRLHESLAHGIQALGWGVNHLDALRFRHHGYDLALVADRGKAERNIRLAELDTRDWPDQPEIWLNLARSQVMAQQYEAALASFERMAHAGGGAESLPDPMYAVYVFSHQEVLRHLERFADADAVLSKGLARLPGYPDFLFDRGNVRYRLGRLAEARADFEACLVPPKRTFTMSMRPGVRDVLPRMALAQLDAVEAAPSLTACLIVKNETRHLPRCLASLEGVVSEIVVVDTGSTDDTVAIAEAAGAKVGHFAWCDDFSAARNAALALATGKWVLTIDADEELVVDDPALFAAALADDELGAVIFPIHNLKDDGGVLIQPMLRLFRRDPRVRYQGRLHEEVTRSIEALQWRIQALPGVHLRHHGYAGEVIAARDKWSRNLQIAIAEVEGDPENPLAWYNVGRASLFTGQTDPAREAFAYVEQLLAGGKQMGEAPYCSYMALRRRLALEAGDAAGAEALMDEGLAKIPGFPEFHYERGVLRRARGDLAGARADFEACLQPRERYYTATMRSEVLDAWPRQALAELAEGCKP